MKNFYSTIGSIALAADACERSWSITDAGIEERALFFFDATPEAIHMLGQAASALGIGTALLAGWSTALAGADAVGLALRRDRQSVRLYTQHWNRLVARVEAGDLSPWPLYRGFKSLENGETRSDEYWCLPMADRTLFWPAMAQAMTDLGLSPERAEAAFAPLDAHSAIFTATRSSARQSWLTTVRRAPLNPEDIAALLAPLDARPGGAAIAQAARTDPLVHVAGGEDRTKGRFVTLYFQSPPDTVLAWF